jgi:hypothetical protein
LPKNQQTPIGEALYKAIVASRLNDKFQEPLYIALELIRAGALHGDLWEHEEISGGASMDNGMCTATSLVIPLISILCAASDNQCMLLFMRSISILPLLTRVRLFTLRTCQQILTPSPSTERTLGWSFESRATGIQLFRQWIIKDTSSFD